MGRSTRSVTQPRPTPTSLASHIFSRRRPTIRRVSSWRGPNRRARSASAFPCRSKRAGTFCSACASGSRSPVRHRRAATEMKIQIRHISTRFAILVGVCAVVPLLAYGLVSILSLQRGTRESVVNGNQNVAVRAAEEIRRYVVSNAELLKALAADLQDTGLDRD